MHTVAVAASALAFAASAMAQVEGFAVMSAPAKDEKVAAGATYSIQWDAGTYTGPVAISLLGGKSPETLEAGAQLASSIPVTASTFDWKVDCTLGADETYGLKIASVADESLFQYSFPFHIDNSGCTEGGEKGGDKGGNQGGYPTISVSLSGYPTHTPHASWSSDWSTSSSVAPPPPPAASSSVAPPPPPASSSVAPPPPPAANTSAPVYPTTVAPPAETTPAPVKTTPVPVAPTSSLITYTASEAPSATQPPAASAVPVAAAGKNTAGAFAAVVGIVAAVLAL